MKSNQTQQIASDSEGKTKPEDLGDRKEKDKRVVVVRSGAVQKLYFVWHVPYEMVLLWLEHAPPTLHEWKMMDGGG